MDIDQILENIYTLPQSSRESLKAIVTEVMFPKNYLLLKEEKVESALYFIKSGIARAFSTIDGNEVTFWFGKEGSTLMSIKSYVSNSRSYENVELLEDCVLYKMENEALQQLFVLDVHIANWGRKFAETELIKTEERLISLQILSARERYLQLLENSHELLQRVALGHIASYLGITQVSLSRIRAEIKL